MRWFSGSITDAVVASKSKGAVFVVFVEGTDEASKSTAEAIETQEVSSSLESSDFVAIKLGSGTEEYKQFTEIYRIVPIPSIFFIGSDGRPIEIVAGASTAAQISHRITTVLEKTKDGQRAAIPTPKQDDLQKTETVDVAGPSGPGESATGEGAAVAAERLAAARALLEKTRALAAAEAAAAERQREEERRRVGREVQELQRWQQDQEMKQLREEREREKREDTAARDRVKRQIEADKAERARKSREATGLVEPKPAPASPAPVATPTTSNSGTARLQLRLPDGSTAVTTLASTDTLSSLRTFAAGACQRGPQHFTLSTAFPRRELDRAQDGRTLAELELTPTAVVLVLPVASSGVVRSGSSGIVTPLTALFWSLLAPVFSLAAYLRGWLGGGAPRPAGQSGPGISRSGGQSVGGRAQGGTGPGRTGPPTAQVRRQGNVHRLATARDSSDDETNTWNGNSTQQM